MVNFVPLDSPSQKHTISSASFINSAERAFAASPKLLYFGLGHSGYLTRVCIPRARAASIAIESTPLAPPEITTVSGGND